MSKELPVLKKGSFYYIKDDADCIVLEDKTKRGLKIRERTVDEKLRVEADKGVIHDMDGIGRMFPIRWFFPKSEYAINDVMAHAQEMEVKYTKLRELTCPDD